MILGPPPLQMGQKLWSLLGSGPGSSCQSRYSVTDCQIHPFVWLSVIVTPCGVGSSKRLRFVHERCTLRSGKTRMSPL